MKAYQLSQEEEKSRVNFPKDKNQQFIRSLDKTYPQELKKNTPIVKQNLRRIKQKLQVLSYHQQLQWAQTMLLKCKCLHKSHNQKDLSIAIKTLVTITNQLKIEYDRLVIEHIIRQLYYDKYGQEIVELFQKVDYPTAGYQLLYYQEPWYSKFYNSVVSIF